MDVYEDSIPFRFTPDGLSEAAIDALIEETCGEYNDPSTSPPVDLAEMRRTRRRAGRVSPNPNPFGDEAA